MTTDTATELAEALKALPTFTPPQDGWQRIADRLPPVPDAVRRGRRAWPRALAAGLVLATMAALFWPVGLPQRQAQRAAADRPNAELALLMQQSHALEAALRSARSNNSVWDAGNARLAERLQRGIALLDGQLDALPADAVEAPASTELWRRRVQLMAQLLRTHRSQGFGEAAAAAVSSSKTPSTLLEI